MFHESQIDNLWNQYYPQVFAYFFKRVDNYHDCEELASTAMTIFLDKIVQDKLHLDNYYGYLWSICRTQLVNYIRAKKPKPALVSIESDQEIEIQGLEQSISKQYEQLILSVFEQAKNLLTSEELYLLRLSYQEGKNSHQIASELSSNSVAIRKRISRVILKLKTNLKPIS